jgi:UDP-glucose 4-epimerase
MRDCIGPSPGKKKWLITGGCGFIGTSLIKQLVAEGRHSIRVVDNLSVGNREDLASVCDFSEILRSQIGTQTKSVELLVGDILDDKLALGAAQGIDVIVHFAANTGVGPSVEDPRSDCVTNVIGTLNYLEAARHRKVRRFIFASSGAPIGECEPPIHEEMPPHPVSPYGASKLAGEGYCSAYFRTYGIETVALRFGNVYGPGSGHKNSVVAKFIRQAISGQTLEIYGDGTQTRDFIYIEDLVRAIRMAATADNVGGEIFQIATNSETTINEVADQLLSVLDQAGINGVNISKTAPRLGDVRRNFSNTSKAKEKLGWEMQVPLKKGIRETVSWFRES